MLGRVRDGPARSHSGVAIALPVLCQCLYGQATLHVPRLHDACGHRGQWGWRGALKTAATCAVVDLSLHRVRR